MLFYKSTEIGLILRRFHIIRHPHPVISIASLGNVFPERWFKWLTANIFLKSRLIRQFFVIDIQLLCPTE